MPFLSEDCDFSTQYYWNQRFRLLGVFSVRYISSGFVLFFRFYFSFICLIWSAWSNIWWVFSTQYYWNQRFQLLGFFFLSSINLIWVCCIFPFLFFYFLFDLIDLEEYLMKSAHRDLITWRKGSSAVLRSSALCLILLDQYFLVMGTVLIRILTSGFAPPFFSLSRCNNCWNYLK